MCPATGTGKMLSPMDLILKLRDHLTDKGAAVTSKAPWVPVVAFNNTQGNQLAMMATWKRTTRISVYNACLRSEFNRRCYYRRRDLGMYNVS